MGYQFGRKDIEVTAISKTIAAEMIKLMSCGCGEGVGVSQRSDENQRIQARGSSNFVVTFIFIF